MRILVTGGAGFLGSHLIDHLLVDPSNEIICLDNYFTGSKSNFDHLDRNEQRKKRVEFIRHDVTQPILLEVDQIYHLACPASPIHYQYNPVKTVKTGVLGTLNMLGLAKRVKARFFLASTSEIYGDPNVHPQVEEYWGNVNPIGIRSCYDESKRVSETLTYDYHRQSKVDVRVVRIFNCYGPRMLKDDGRVVSNFIYQALDGKPLTVYGDGSQTRSFCYVSDMVKGFINLMNSDYIYPVNIGNPSEYTILQLAEMIKDIVDPKLEIIHKPLPLDDPRKRQPDISKAQKYLNWTPTVDIKKGLHYTVGDFRYRYFPTKVYNVDR